MHILDLFQNHQQVADYQLQSQSQSQKLPPTFNVNPMHYWYLTNNDFIIIQVTHDFQK